MNTGRSDGKGGARATNTRASGQGKGNGCNSPSGSHCSTQGGPVKPPVHGTVLGDTWVKLVWQSQHLRRSPFEGWAADAADVVAAKTLGLRWVRLDEQEHHTRFWASIDDVLHKGRPFDYGCGKQLCLALSAWHVGEKPPEPLAVQAVLWQ